MLTFASHDHMEALTAYDLAQAAAFAAGAFGASPLVIQFGIAAVTGTLIQQARQDLLEDAVRNRVSHLIMVDADMRFPRNLVPRLFNASRDRAVVGVNAAKRAIPLAWTARKDGQQVRTTADSTGVEEVDSVGFGAAIINLAHIEKNGGLPESPWFSVSWLPEHAKWESEDVHFCRRLREAGHKVFVDHDLSKEIGHVGRRTYTTLDVEAWETMADGEDN